MYSPQALIGIFRAAVWADGGVHRFGQSGVFVEFQFVADALETHKLLLLKTGLPYIGLQANWQQIITGAVLIIAVLIDIMKEKKAAAK